MAKLISIQEIQNANWDTDVDAPLSDGYSYTNITTSAQTLVKSGAGFLKHIVIGESPTSAVRLYDNTVSGGTTIGDIGAATADGITVQYGLKFDNGLVISSGSSDTNITIIYK